MEKTIVINEVEYKFELPLYRVWGLNYPEDKDFNSRLIYTRITPHDSIPDIFVETIITWFENTLYKIDTDDPDYYYGNNNNMPSEEEIGLSEGITLVDPQTTIQVVNDYKFEDDVMFLKEHFNIHWEQALFASHEFFRYNKTEFEALISDMFSPFSPIELEGIM